MSQIKNRPELLRKLAVACRLLPLLALGWFSFIVSVVMKNVRGEVAEDMPISPITHFTFTFGFLIHLPLIALAIIMALHFAGAFKRQEMWLWLTIGCLSVFAILAAIWLMGATLPFWTIPARIGGN